MDIFLLFFFWVRIRLRISYEDQIRIIRASGTVCVNIHEIFASRALYPITSLENSRLTYYFFLFFNSFRLLYHRQRCLGFGPLKNRSI